jgi:homoserine kinase
VQPVQQEQFMESMPYWEPIWNQRFGTAMQGENWLYAHADNVALPFGWIYVSEKLQPIRYYKIESPSELYATVVHPQIELKHQMRVPY